MSNMDQFGGVATTMPPKNSESFRRTSDINISDGQAALGVSVENYGGHNSNNMNIDSNHNNAGEDLGLGMSGSGNSLGTFEALENP